jgi:hypothetical protein
VDGERASARARTQPVADELVVQEKRARGSALVGRPLAHGRKRAMRNADRRKVQDRTEVQREACSAWMVTAGRIDEEHVRWLPEGADGGLQQRSFTECEQARLIRSAGAARQHDGLATDTRRCPGRISGAVRPAAAASEADEDRADACAWLEPPRPSVERGHAQLLLDQLLTRARPLAHALILASWTRWS